MTLQLGPTTYEPPPAGLLGHGAITAGLPFVGNITSPFGPRAVTPELAGAGANNPQHDAIDIAPFGGEAGVPWACPVSGTVVRADDVTGPGDWYKGFWLEVETPDGQNRIGTYHLAEAARNYETGEDLRPGDFVRRGQVIGVVGTTGASTGIHSHFYVMARVDDGTAEGQWVFVDPVPYFVVRPIAVPSAFPPLTRRQLGVALIMDRGFYVREGAYDANSESYRILAQRDAISGDVI